mmetsp:Transcript_15790/g.19022  ORF Transcript_15790/g.19022 Transcript_15790/m.19022 type:complete len:87 (+) Transcript_15790:2384-2644(+)
MIQWWGLFKMGAEPGRKKCAPVASQWRSEFCRNAGAGRLHPGPYDGFFSTTPQIFMTYAGTSPGVAAALANYTFFNPGSEMGSEGP